MLDDLFYGFEIFFWRILFIKNAIILISQSDTSKTVIAGETLFTVPEVSTMEDIETKVAIIGLDGSERLI